MTSTLPQPAAVPVDRTLRTLTIAANLLPTEVVEARRNRQVRRLVLTALAGFLALIAAWYGFASYQTMRARDSLESVQSEASSLRQQQKKYAKLSNIQTQSKMIDGQLASLFADDLQWTDLLAKVQAAAPAGVQVTGITGSMRSGLVADASSAQSAVPNPSGKPLVGTLTIVGGARSKAEIGTYIAALTKTPGVANPLLSGFNAQQGDLTYTVTVDITADSLGGRYTPAPAKTKGGK